VHDGYGDELYFSVLAQHLPRELPAYGLPGISPNESPLHTMKAMAERMVQLLQQAQASGPYRLAGWSFGGVLAYEITQQLLDQGHAVEFLGLMDAFCPAGDGPADNHKSTPEAVLIELCEEERAHHRPGAPSATPAFDIEGSPPDFTELFNRFRELRALPAKLEHLSPQEALAQCRNLEINSRVMAAYRPRPMDIPVHLFVASERPQGWAGPGAWLGWERCVPVHLLCPQAVPGSHYSMMTAPHIQVLGQKLAEGLAAAAEIKVCP
jgi:arthrofactin-type cyclic lipopeptide synthetase C